MKTKLLGSAFVFLTCALIFAGCTEAETPTTQAVSAKSPTISEATKKAWNAYVLSVPLENLQPQCQPKRYAAQGELKGVVVLFHGYSACPQQYWELAPELAAKGFEVYLPLLPGAGRKKILDGNKVTDDVSELPRLKNWSEYLKLADEMTVMAAATSGVRRVVGGLSLGGAVATYAALSPKHRGVWTRSLMMAPMYYALEGSKEVLLESMARLPFVDNIGYGWGPGCKKDSSTAPQFPWNSSAHVRGGICDFQYTHLGAAQALGENALGLLKSLAAGRQAYPVPHQIQVVSTEFDAATRPKSLVALQKWGQEVSSRRLNGVQTLKQSGCAYPSSVPHSFISRWDRPEILGDDASKKFWLPSLISNTVLFVTIGKAFPSSGSSSVLTGYSMCDFSSGQSDKKEAADKFQAPPMMDWSQNLKTTVYLRN